MTPIGIAIFIAVAIAAMADLYMTKRTVHDDPTHFLEGNPLMRAFTFWGMAVAKVALVAACGLALSRYRNAHQVEAACAFAAGLWGWLAWRNRKLRRRR